jgi:hypothetical protein
VDNRKNNGGHSTAGKAGRKPLSDEIKGFTLAQPHVEDAFRVLAEIMIDEAKRPSDRIASAKILIEYGCGKPKEHVEQDININTTTLKDLISFGSAEPEI